MSGELTIRFVTRQDYAQWLPLWDGYNAFYGRSGPTALAPEIGYDKAAEIAKAAHANGTTLREEALRLGYVNEKTFDRLMQPEKMTRPG